MNTRTIAIDPVTRIEGHAKITIQLGDDDEVTGTGFHVTQVRGFEKFTEGRPFYEMPSITARICGICPISHLLASAKACDAIMNVGIPPTAAKLREAMHCGQIIQSHALSFFHLSGPDLILGFDSPPERRNVLGLLEVHPDMARDGVGLRKFGQQVIEGLGRERIHPSWIVPGGVNTPLDAAVRERILHGLPEAKAIAARAIAFFKGVVDNFPDEIAHFGNAPTMYAGLVDNDGGLQLYDGSMRFVGADGKVEVAAMPAADYQQYIGEASEPNSYLKSPYYKPFGYPEGIYRVGPLARLNVATHCGHPQADAEFAEYHQRFGRVVQSSFHFHYARLVEIVYALERLEALMEAPDILSTNVRAHAGVNALEGVGIAEAPRGTLIHHYKVNESGAIVWANLIVATGHNNLAISRSVDEVARHFIHQRKLAEGVLNRVSAVVRAYDPCLSCSTHAVGGYPIEIRLVDAEGQVLDMARN